MENLDLKTMMEKALSESLDPEKIQKKINEGVESLVDNVLKEELFGHWGIVAKGFKKYLEENSEIDYSKLPIEALCVSIGAQLGEHIKRFDETTRRKQVEELAKTLLCQAPEEYKLSELIESLINEFGNLDESCPCGPEEERQIEIEIENTSSTYSDFKMIHFKFKDQHDDEQHLQVHISQFDKNNIIGIRFDGEDLEKSLKEEDVSRWQGLLISCKRGDTKIIIDIDDGDGFPLTPIFD